MGSGVAALMETNRLLGPQRLPSPACTHISPPCTTPREKPPGRTGLHGDCRGQTSGSTSAHFRARPVLQGNERRLRTAASAGDRGVSARSGAPGTTHRRPRVPRSSPGTPVPLRPPGRGRAPARANSLTHSGARACAQRAPTAPPSFPSPARPSRPHRKRAEPRRKKKKASTAQDFLPANFPSHPLG